jgi:hypothetical protein
MYRSVDPEEHLQTKDIQNKIRGYAAGCSTFTDSGQLCRSSFSTNKLINPYTKKQIDCNWYCLRKCSPQKMLPIFDNIPKYVIETDGTKVPVEQVMFSFKISERDGDNAFVIVRHNFNSNNNLWEWTDNRHHIKTISSDASWHGEGKSFRVLAEQMCKWFSMQDEKMNISLECIVAVERGTQFRTFSRFDIPFLRPVSEWTGTDTIVTTKFAINKTADFQEQKQIAQTIESSGVPWENLPIGLAEEPELFSLYGMAHQNIPYTHKRRETNPYGGPRHFHASERKVSRKSRHRK